MWITNPLLALGAYALAIGTSALLLRAVPALSQNLESLKNKRFVAIDGLRGYLAFGVFIHHTVITWFYLQTGKIEVPPSNFYTQIGVTSVALFFMITGFLFWGRLLQQGRDSDWLAFTISRLFRIYPLYLLLLLVVVLTIFHQQNWELKDSIGTLAGQIGRWLTFDRPDINQYPQSGMLISNVTWTLNYELFFYATLPLFGAIFVYRRHWLHIVLCLIGIYLIYRLIGWDHGLKKRFILSFLGGIAAAYWVRRPDLLAWGQSRVAGVIALLALLIVLTAFSDSFALGPLLLLTLFFVVVASGNTLFGTLKLRSIHWMGEISYSTYLLHGFLLWLMMQRLPLVLPYELSSPLSFLLRMALSSCLLIVLSSLTFWYIEKPGIALGKKALSLLRSHLNPAQVST
jgi:peptidoglycan/LPS O-acetylase OafA/YrhL